MKPRVQRSSVPLLSMNLSAFVAQGSSEFTQDSSGVTEAPPKPGEGVSVPVSSRGIFTGTQHLRHWYTLAKDTRGLAKHTVCTHLDEVKPAVAPEVLALEFSGGGRGGGGGH